MTFAFTPIGVVRTPFLERVSAPRQPAAARGIPGRIELARGRDFEHALSDIEGWERLWVVYVFHLNRGWRPKVLPPRSHTRRGVFATRSPHRPNAIGLSVVRLTAVSGLTLHIEDVDMIDGSPVLDIKPYVPYADAFPDARAGWLDAEAKREAADPLRRYRVVFTDGAEAEAAFLEARGVPLRARVEAALSLGPEPHPYRRIRETGSGFRLAAKDWRVDFRVEGDCVTVERITTGYRPSQLWGDGSTQTGDALDVHRAFVERFAKGDAG
jgi:tRNA-Thr(GGU) m(6)t(6)A37 methyltransferase TsaA